ncbi:MAG: subclass B1 metallo-beta-lactamase [Deltaproteobacteria bacterium]|nr:subclass B1 metallo-beta-lactamase [Deltaproteobacteria bacterium]
MRSLLVSCLLLAACTPVPAPVDNAPTLEPLAENVWLHGSHRDIARVGLVLSHGLVIRSAEGVLLVDTAWDDADTEEILRRVRAEVGANVDAAVVTHAHADKMGGMAALRLAGIRSFAHVLSSEDAPARGLEPASDALFADGARERVVMGAVVFHPGPGHTRDNLVVYFAPARVLFGGCLIRPGDSRDLGNTADGDVARWADTVRAVRARFPETRIVVPSHGPPGGPELLDHTIALAERAARR